ncbi:MAG: 60S ribosomal protein L31 [Thaumarchaeota archaeon]|nr:60S ribosomal protein L31 [Nitrososphaerota archaeon]MDG6906590.1 60S ribosomal protein L31 [Nitrososphaerota archaeon]
MSEQKAELERLYTVPLSRAWIAARHRRTRRAVNILREFAEKHMKSSEIKIDTDLNEELWKRGITKPPRRITVRMEKDEDGVVTISLPKKVEEVKEEAEALKEEPKAEVEKAQEEPAAVEETPAKSVTAKKPKKATSRKSKKAK